MPDLILVTLLLMARRENESLRAKNKELEDKIRSLTAEAEAATACIMELHDTLRNRG